MLKEKETMIKRYEEETQPSTSKRKRGFKQEQVDEEPCLLQENSPGSLFNLDLLSVGTIFLESNDEKKRVSPLVLHSSLARHCHLLWMGNRVKYDGKRYNKRE